MAESGATTTATKSNGVPSPSERLALRKAARRERLADVLAYRNSLPRGDDTSLDPQQDVSG